MDIVRIDHKVTEKHHSPAGTTRFQGNISLSWIESHSVRIANCYATNYQLNGGFQQNITRINLL